KMRYRALKNRRGEAVLGMGSVQHLFEFRRAKHCELIASGVAALAHFSAEHRAATPRQEANGDRAYLQGADDQNFHELRRCGKPKCDDQRIIQQGISYPSNQRANGSWEPACEQVPRGGADSIVRI